MLPGIAFVIAAPVAWIVMNGWLEDFAYRVDIGVGTIALAAVLAAFVALASVIWQAVQAAIANPVDAIRSE